MNVMNASQTVTIVLTPTDIKKLAEHPLLPEDSEYGRRNYFIIEVKSTSNDGNIISICHLDDTDGAKTFIELDDDDLF